MQFEKALLIFGIKRNYTEEELKKIYRKLVRENHPDYHMNATEKEQIEYNRKLQEINEAYNILKKNLNKNNGDTYEKSSSYSKTQSSEGYTWKKYDQTIILKQIEMVHKIKNYYKQCEAKKLMEYVSDLILKYIRIITNSEEMDSIFINFKTELEKIYKNYIPLYCQKHQIPSFIMKQKDFKYDCDCAKLFHQIKSCERVIDFDTGKILRKYNFDDQEETLKKQMFLERDNWKKKLNFNTPKSKYYELLYKLEYTIGNLVEKHQIKQDDTEINSSTIPKNKGIIFAGLRQKYLDNSNNTEIANKLFITAAELLYREDCSLELANEIDKITFQVPEEEYDRLIKLSTNKVKTFNEFLCIKKECHELDYNLYKVKIISSNEKNYYKVKKIDSPDEIIDEKTLEENYINIDTVLSEAIFLGYKQESYPFDEILYHNPNNGMTIIRFPMEGVYAIVKELPYDGSFKRNKKTDIYQNKAYLKEELSNFFYRLYEEKTKKSQTK